MFFSEKGLFFSGRNGYDSFGPGAINTVYGKAVLRAVIQTDSLIHIEETEAGGVPWILFSADDPADIFKLLWPHTFSVFPHAKYQNISLLLSNHLNLSHTALVLDTMI